MKPTLLAAFLCDLTTSAVHLPKLTKLKSFILNTPKVTAAVLKNLNRLPLEYLMLNEGAVKPASEAIATAKSIPTLHRISKEVEMYNFRSHS